ncbi:MAG: hypothetical protein HY955_01715 [Deltaproteobacteria bacterium]|nr:hypothetical protein [Deltaproteobacteria bacterium]
MTKIGLSAWKFFSNPARPQIAASEWLIIASLKNCSPRCSRANGCSEDKLFDQIRNNLKTIYKSKPNFFLLFSTGCNIETVLDYFAEKNLVELNEKNKKIYWKITDDGETYINKKAPFAEKVFGDKIVGLLK